MIDLAFSGKPSFFTRGQITAFVGAILGSNFITVRLFSVSSQYESDNTANSILFKPAEVSIMYGKYLSLFS